MRLTVLKQILIERFNMEELESLCFDIDVDFEVLSGENKEKKVIELVKYVKRRNELDKLIDAAKTERPSAAWDELY